MKIGIMSDTHLMDVTAELKAIMETRFRDADLILHAGDIVSGRVLDYLEHFNVVAVRGNMDGLGVAERLPARRVVKAGPYRIGLIHGWGSPDSLPERARNEFERLDCLVFGHTHRPLSRKVGRELWFNPGTATSPRGNGRSVGLLTIGDEIKSEIIYLDEE